MQKLFSIALLFLAISVNAQQKVALVVGNNDYKDYPLKNACNDARLMGSTLEKLGFTVTRVMNASKAEFEKQLITFNRTYKNADVRFFYYAGHGVQFDGDNYLVPLDARLEDKEDIKLEGIDFSTIFSIFQNSKQHAMNIFVMDACRNNPFKNRSWGSRGGDDRGLVLKKTDFAIGSFAAFSADNGQKASDGSGSNGLYTNVLAESLLQPGIEINILFQRVRNRVIQLSNGEQTPVEENRLISDKGFYFIPAVDMPPPVSGFKKYYYYVDQHNTKSTQQFETEDEAEIYMKTKKVYGKVYSNTGEVFIVDAPSTPVKPTVDDSKPSPKQEKDVIKAAQQYLNQGVELYGLKKYEEAYSSFDHFRQLMPDDTTAIYYTAIAATQAEKYDAAISNYIKLITTRYSKVSSAYNELAKLYLVKQDTTSALNTLNRGIVKFPLDGELRKLQIEIYLTQGKAKDVLTLLETAIVNDPGNKTLYYYQGIIYSQMADRYGIDLKKTVDPIESNRIKLQRSTANDQAAESYKKALAIDPDYFDANLNMGYILITPAIEIYNNANKLPMNKQKEYDAMMVNARQQFDLSKPFLLKASQLNPRSIDALTNLKTYYVGTHNTSAAEEITKQLNALKQ